MPGIAIHRERIGIAVAQETAGPSGQILFAVPLGPDGSWRVNAELFDEHVQSMDLVLPTLFHPRGRVEGADRLDAGAAGRT